MKIKRFIRFYFSAGSLDKALNNLILHYAVKAGEDIYSGCEPYADKIMRITEVKQRLGQLWARLDEVFGAMTDRDRATLKRYALLRHKASGNERKEVHRAVVKFTRRAGGLIDNSGDLYKLMCAYECLLSPSPD